MKEKVYRMHKQYGGNPGNASDESAGNGGKSVKYRKLCLRSRELRYGNLERRKSDNCEYRNEKNSTLCEVLVNVFHRFTLNYY